MLLHQGTVTAGIPATPGVMGVSFGQGGTTDATWTSWATETGVTLKARRVYYSPAHSGGIPTVYAATVASSGGKAQFTSTGMGTALGNGQGVVLTGSMPGGFTAGVEYYTVSAGTNTVELAATVGGTAISFTTGGSGCQVTPVDSQLQICLDLGLQACISYIPTFSGSRTSDNLPSAAQMQTDQTAMVAHLTGVAAAFTALGLTPGYVAVTMCHEPSNTGGTFVTPAQFVNLYSTPASGGMTNYQALHAICPVWVDYLGNSSAAAQAEAYWPAGFCDGLAVDLYCGNGTHLALLQSVWAPLANDAGALLGLWEFGNTAEEANAPTPANMITFLQGLATYFGAGPGGRLASGLANGQLIWFEDDSTSSTFTASGDKNASACKFTCPPADTPFVGQQVTLGSGRPGGFSGGGQIYWVVQANATAGTFHLAATAQGAQLGSTSAGSCTVTTYGANAILTPDDYRAPYLAQLEAALTTAGTPGTTTDSVWQPIGGWVYPAGGLGTPAVSITRGRPDESPSPVPCTIGFQVTNTDARFSPHNANSPWFGLFGRNTPCRVSIPAASTALRMEDGTTSYAATGAITPPSGDVDIQVECFPSGWTASVLASEWQIGGFAWMFGYNADGTLTFWWTTDDFTNQQASSTMALPWMGGRVSLRAVYAHTTGLVSFYYATSLNGPWVPLGSPTGSIFGPHTGAVYAGTSPFQVGANSYFETDVIGTLDVFGGLPGRAWAPAQYQGMTGKVYEARLYNGAGGTLLADGQFTAQTPGTTTWADGQGNTWALSGTAEISGRNYRAHAEVSEWPPQWASIGYDAWTPVTASGILRRLQQKAPPLQSSMTRGWQRYSGNAPPVAYWPCEDGSGATQIASGLQGGLTMNFFTGTPQLASNSDFVSSSALPNVNKSAWKGRVAAYTQPPNPANILRFLLEVPSGGDTDTGVIARMHTTGTVYRFDLMYGTTSNGSLRLLGYDGNFNNLIDTGYITFGVDGLPFYVSVEITTSGSNLHYAVSALQPAATSQVGFGGTLSSASVGTVYEVLVNPQPFNVLASTVIGQISLQTQFESMYTGPIAGPLNAWEGETAGLRFARLCAEENLPCRITGYPAASVAMGPQAPDTLMNLLQECETADHGIIIEPARAYALGYRTSNSMAAQAQSPSGLWPMVLHYGQGQLGGGALQPTDDDQLILNDCQVTRGNSTVTGSSLTVQLTEGAMSLQMPPDGAGDYQGAVTVNCQYDSMLFDQGNWVVHLGTVDEYRFPVVPIDLADTDLTSIFYPVMDLDGGDYLQISFPPAFVQADPIKQVISGISEQLSWSMCMRQFAALPESPWEVLVAGDDSRAD